MKSKKFPTKKAFIEWWDSKEDKPSLAVHRSGNCPLAKYFKAHGYKNADVSPLNVVYMGDNCDTYSILTPKWAQRFIRKADAMKVRYNGLPKGFR